MEHGFIKGAAVKVENGRAEILYSGKVVDVEGDKVKVTLPAAFGKRPAVFDLASPDVSFKAGEVIFASW